MTQSPGDAWSCHACQHTNPASRASCTYCGLDARASGSAIAARREQLLGPAHAKPPAADPDMDHPLELVRALSDLPVLQQVFGAVCITLLGAGLYFYITAETLVVEILALALVFGANYALYVLVKANRRARRPS